CGGSEATPCDASVRRRSTRSSPAPRSGSSASSDVITGDNLTPVMEELELIRDFVNTWDADDDSDELEPWLAERGLGADIREAVRVREAIRALLLANNGIRVDVEAASRVLDAAARRARLGAGFAAGNAVVSGHGGLGVLLG